MLQIVGVAFSSLAAEEANTAEDLDRTTLSLPGKGLNLGGIDSHVLRPMMVALTMAEAGSGVVEDEGRVEEEATFLARASTAAAFDSKSALLLAVLVLLVSSLK